MISDLLKISLIYYSLFKSNFELQYRLEKCILFLTRQKRNKVMFNFEKHHQTDINIQEKMFHNW